MTVEFINYPNAIIQGVEEPVNVSELPSSVRVGSEVEKVDGEWVMKTNNVDQDCPSGVCGWADNGQ